MKKYSNILLWSMVVIYALAVSLPPLFEIQSPINAFINTAAIFSFALIHGTIRYGIRNMIVFLAICLVISNIMENLSILTGFPFGHYYYSAELGPKLFLVPLLIGPAYFGTGYIAWTLANVMLDGADRLKNNISVIGLPVIASFLMASWDLCLDPTNATINKQWIWQDGGGYFGVPFVNFLGWYFTVYVFFQIFAIYLFKQTKTEPVVMAKEYWFLAAAFYLAISFRFFANMNGLPNVAVTDTTGKTWQTGDIYETSALISIFTLVFGSVLAFLKSVQLGDKKI